MEELARFEGHRFIGDKRNQVVFDLESVTDADRQLLDELVAAEAYACFAPDTLAEARNRGYRLRRGRRR